MPNTIRRLLPALSVATVLFWLPVIVFSKLAGEVIEREPIALDISILHWIHTQSTHLLDTVFLTITTIGNAEIIAPLAVLTSAYLWSKRQRTNSLIVLFGFFGAGIANITLKLLFHRDRPAFWKSAITETGYSFPSGHAMLSCALALSLIAVAWPTRWRWPTVALGALLVFLIGFSRLYLGVHYPTDIIAGWSASLVWVSLVVWIARSHNPFHRKKTNE